MKCRLACLVIALVGFVIVPLVSAAPIGPTSPTGPTAEDIAKEHIRTNRPDLAIDALKKALAKTPEAARLHYWLGIAYAQDGKPDLAEAEFKTVLQQDPDFIEAHLRLVELAVQRISPSQPKAKNLELITAAIDQLSAAIKKNPNDVKPRYDLAGLYVDSSRFREQDPEAGFTEALKVLAEAQKKEPDEVRPYLAQGNVRIQHADFIAAGKRFADLTGDPAKKANALLDQAIADFRKALTINPRFLLALNRIAAIQSARGSVKEAVKTIEDHLPKLEDPLEKATGYRWMAQYLMQDKDLAGAESKLNLAIKTAPNELASYLLLANVLLQRTQVDQAADILKKSIKTNANFLNGYVELGVLELRRRNITEASENFKSALNVAPARAVVVSSNDKPVQNVLEDLYSIAAVQLGDILVSKSEFDEAILVFRRLATIFPNSALPEFQIGEVHRRKNENEVAKEHYENALRRDKKFIQARAALAELEAQDIRLAPTSKERAAILERAIDQYELALEVTPNNAAVLDRLADLRVQLAKCSAPVDRAMLERALANSKKAAEAAPESINFRRHLAFIYNEMGNKNDAAAELTKLVDSIQKVIEKEPDNVSAIFLVADLRCTLNTWQPDPAVLKQAIDGFALAVKKQPEFLQGYLSAAFILEQQKDYKASAEWYTKLLAAAKGDAPYVTLPAERARFAIHASAVLAWINVEYLGNLDDARKYAKIAQELDPNLASLLDTVGWINYKAGKFEEALPDLRRASKAAPTNATVGYHLGAALIKCNSPDRAKEALLEAQKYVGDDADLKDKIGKLLKSLGG